MTTDLAVGQARSLLWAARHMQDLLNVVAKVPNADAVQASGCFFSAILLRPEPRDFVIDPFGGSCVAGEVCERTNRRWICVELLHEYCEAVLGRFIRDPEEVAKPVANPQDPANYYRVPRPGILWNGDHNDSLAKDGGKRRRLGDQRRTDDGSRPA